MKLGKYNFKLTSPTVMGICNVTPDSFSDGGKSFKSLDALKNIKEMVKNGASIIDIGAESTRPGSDPLTHKDEVKRLLEFCSLLNIPFLPEVSRRFDCHFDSSIFLTVFDNSSLICS